LGDYQHIIESFTFITGAGGIFDFRVDGELLFSKKALGRHAEPGEILALFRQHVGPSTPTYPRPD
jgi:selenoprotein W-related protein